MIKLIFKGILIVIGLLILIPLLCLLVSFLIRLVSSLGLPSIPADGILAIGLGVIFISSIVYIAKN